MNSRHCKKCGSEITSRYPRVRFCSPKCWYDSKRAPQQEKLKFRKRKAQQVECKNCGKLFWRWPSYQARRYCSFKCSIPASRKQVPVKCARCGKEFTRGKALVRRVKNCFCGPDCSKAFHRGENAAIWRGGQSKHYRGSDWWQKSKDARERDRHECQVCGKPEQKGQKLSVDHIVPYRLVKRNDLINLISICRAPCHSKKTMTAEADFLRGDYLSFRQKLCAYGWPSDKIDAAMKWYAELPDAG